VGQGQVEALGIVKGGLPDPKADVVKPMACQRRMVVEASMIFEDRKMFRGWERRRGLGDEDSGSG
jgi:hypothetical protein